MKARLNLILALGMAVAGFAALFSFYGYDNTWKLWNIPTMSPQFADLRPVTAGSQSYRNGYDPMFNNPSDPWKRRQNYPRIWHSLYKLGLNESHTASLGYTVIALFLIGVCLSLDHLRHFEVALVMAAVLSPATLLGVERGNVDLLMFFILAFSIFAIGRWYFVSVMAILLGFLLKLFPVLGLVVLLRKSKPIVLAVAAGAVVFLATYAFFMLKDLQVTYEATQKGAALSYGVNTTWMGLRSKVPALTIPMIVFSSLAALLAILFSFTGLLRKDLDDLAPSSRIDSFRAGAAVYVGTFFIGNNWDYRLIFLIFVIPQLTAWLKCSSRRVSLISTITLVSLYLSLWYLMIERLVLQIPNGSFLLFVIDECANWVLFFGLFYLLMLSMPVWTKQYARKFFSVKPADTNSNQEAAA